MSTKVPGYVVRDGKLEKKPKGQSVSEKIRTRKSKRVRVVRKG